mgnify:CR=1 FL=1
MDLTTWTPVDSDYIPFIDISDTTQSPEWSTKKALKSELKWEKGDKWDTGATWATWATWATGATWPASTNWTDWTNWTNWTDWLDITWKWAYSWATDYVLNDAVSYNWSSYICKLASTWNLPTNTTYFDLMAQKWDSWSGAWDMLASVYDPQNIADDAFDRANHTWTQAVSTITANGNALSWNTDESTVNIPLNANVTLQTGQETLWLGRNSTWSTIPNGTVVYATWTIWASGRITIAPYIADWSIIWMYTLGITTENITAGADWFITHFWKVRNINTSAYAEWVVLYASPATAWALTSTAPSYPQIRIPLAFVITSHASVWTLAVRVPSLDTEMVHKTWNETIAWVKSLTDRLETIEATAVASASTVDLNAINGNYVHITGTTTINSFGSVSKGSYELCFDSAGLVIANGAIRLPTGANITTQAGDTMIVRGETTSWDWRVISYQRKDWSALYSAWGGWWSQTYETFIAWELTTGRILRQTVKTTQTIAWVKITCDTLPTGADLQIQVYKNWIASTNSIFTSDTPISITTAQSATNWVYTTTKTTIDNWSLVADDQLYIYITQIGSTLSWTNLSVLVY